MEVTRESKRVWHVSMRSADFTLRVNQISLRVDVEIVNGRDSIEGASLKCRDMHEALSRITDYYEQGELTNPAGAFPWVMPVRA